MLLLDLGKPGGGQDFRQNLMDVLNNADRRPIRLRAGFAYATYSGVKQLLESLDGLPAWNAAAKLWLLGVHSGITYPHAISSLATLTNSKVRLATCGIATRYAIEGQRVFHAKIMAVDSGRDHALNAIMAGSANLTGAAMGMRARNFEAGMSWMSPVERLVSDNFNSWWEEAWGSGINANSSNVRNYIDLRTEFQLRNPDLLPEASGDEYISASDARVLWLEAGAMSTGGSNNAVDFSSGLASFFGPVSDRTRPIVLSADDDKRWADRPLTPKKTTFNVRLWRLSLPTIAMGGFEYKHRILCFTKLGGGRTPLEFRLDVADPDTKIARDWQRESGRHGTIGRTGGGHNFGFI